MCDGWQQSPNFIQSMLMNCLPSFSVSSHLDLPAWNFWQKNLPPDRRHTSKLSRGGNLVSDAIWASYRETGEGRFRGKHTCPPRGESRTHPRMRSPTLQAGTRVSEDETRQGAGTPTIFCRCLRRSRLGARGVSRATYLLAKEKTRNNINIYILTAYMCIS